MDDFEIRHMMGLYGINPDVPPLAFQFPRIPPRLTTPSTLALKSNKLANEFLDNSSSMITKLQDFRQFYQKYASGLFEISSTGIIPPGHPMYFRANSLETLQVENSKLQKENLELKKQIDKIPKTNSAKQVS